jgi:molybdenum cofactor cytidylyltransferase
LGRPKQFLDIGGIPLVRHVAEIASASMAADVLVVSGEHDDRVRAALSGTRCQIVFNPDYATGQASSVLAGLQALSQTTGAVVFLLGDQPRIRTSTVDDVIKKWTSTGAPIVQARYRGTRSHPVLFDRSLFDELQEISGDNGAAAIIRRHADETVFVDIDADAPLDIDTEEDYAVILSGL